MCECGKCKNCYNRAYMKRWRQRERDGLPTSRPLCQCGKCERCKRRQYMRDFKRHLRGFIGDALDRRMVLHFRRKGWD